MSFASGCSKFPKQALLLLDSVELIEMRSLEWGFTDGSLSENEVLDLANIAGAGNVPGDDLVEELIDTKLIFEIHTSSADVRIRSRFAEMMRTPRSVAAALSQ